MRIDVFLHQQLSQLSRSHIQRLIEQGNVLVDGGVCAKNHRMREGQQVLVEIPQAQPAQVQAQELAIEIVYEDADLLVVNKPKGMVVHPAPGHPDGTLVNALLHHCGGSLSGIGGVTRPGIVHRIDKLTSGLLLVAKNDKAHRLLSQQIGAHIFTREYEAVVRGGIKDDAGTVDAPIGRNPVERKKMAVIPEGGRHAVTHYEVVARYSGYTHVRCRLETGRTHQIRVHMAYLGHPVAGDPVYARARGQEKQLEGQCLHAKKIGFEHPSTHEYMEFDSKLPDYFTKFLTYIQR